ncbi:unnamed protein product [Rotaria sp. Silwood2]|nr:unnamed protein product [Rotaria sp. Silwood2]CAF2726469.1 unnamed protein product [Rotaria sp. Silwood2]CAF2951764.1 unnamed protein product [Rotaria sp. Silwood2]CAF3107958.1 unnamed protein product [Rotaria sp. Silwood2]CAF3914599.1 unnamed protein product [Rotaria sp. Silwood2]
MLVQHFFPSSSATTIFNSSFSPSCPPCISSSLMKNKKPSILSPFFNSESTGFQPTIEQNIHIGGSEKIKTHLSAWPSKLTPVMEIHRQRFSQLNPRFKQQKITTTLLQPIQQSVICPVILPSTTRPQPRQQARSKQHQQTHLPPTQTIRRPNTAHAKQQQSTSESNPQYITLTNLSKILHVLQTQVKIGDNETSTDMSSSTTNSAKQRVQQHLQDTATRWWKPARSSDCHAQVAPPSSIYSYETSATLPSSDIVQHNRQESENFPLITVVSNSTRQLNIPSVNGNGASKYEESESSTEIQTTVITSMVTSPKTTINTKHTRQEPLIMQARGMRLHSYDHHYYFKKQNNMNFLQQQRLIHQTLS